MTTVTSARYSNPQSTQLAATIEGGGEWSGVSCRVVSGVVTIDGDGQIVDAVKAWIAKGNTPTPYALPPPTIADIVAERERRLSLGFNYNFGDARGIHAIGTTASDLAGWDEVTKATQAMIALGQPSATVDIVTNTGTATITAVEWQHVLLAAAAFRQPIWAASFALQTMSPIPTNYVADIYWN